MKPPLQLRVGIINAPYKSVNRLDAVFDDFEAAPRGVSGKWITQS
jgi:hypothetical protein